MKSIKNLILVIIVACASILPANAQFSFGPKVGIAVNDLKYSNEIWNSDNRAGFTGGLMAEFMLPVFNLGIDAAIMYANRSVTANLDFGINSEDNKKVNEKINRNYIDIPLHIKWKIGLPLVGKIVTPFVFTGPNFSFLVSKSTFDDLKNKNFDVAWNLGLGVQLFTKLQVAASYSWGLSEAISIREVTTSIFDTDAVY